MEGFKSALARLKQRAGSSNSSPSAEKSPDKSNNSEKSSYGVFGRQRIAVLLHHRSSLSAGGVGGAHPKSAPGSPSPSVASYGSATSSSDLISSASSALRRLHFRSSNAYRSCSTRTSAGNKMEPPQNVPRVTIGSNSISTESSATMNTSTDSSSTAFTMITMTDAGDPEEVAPGAAATAVASSVIPEEDASASAVITNGSGDTATASSTEKEDEFFSAASSSTDDGSRKSSYELRSMLARNGIGPAEEYDDPVEPLLQHTTVPSENPSKIEDFKVNCFNAAGNIGDQAAAEWYQVKMKQQKSCAEGGGQRKTAQCRRRAKLLSRKYTKCFFEEERVRNDLGRNSSGFAAEQMTVDSEDSFQWESSSIASPPVPVSPTGSVSPSETGEQPLTVLSPMKTKQHFTFPPLTEANDLLNELKVKVDRNNKRNQEVAQSSTGRRESSGAAKKPKSDRRASITPSARTRSEEGRPSDDRRRHQPSSAIATIVVQQASVTGSSPEQQHQQQQQQLQHSSDDEAAVCRESCSCVLIDACCQASLANQRQHVLLVATATNSHSQSATSSDESVKSDRTIVNYNCNNNAFLLGAKKQRTPSHSEGMKHQMLDVTNTTNIGLYHWNDHDPKCSSSHHNRSQSVRTPGSKSNVQDRTSNGNCVNGGKYRPNYLCLPQQRSRVASMPNTGQEEEYYRLRQFSITGKGIINRGDSLKSRRSRSNTSVASSNSSHSTEYVTTCGTGCAVLGSTGGCNSLAGTISAAPSLPSSRESSCASCPGINPPYRVIMLGSSGVGKSSLVSQFMTSEYLQASGISIDEDFGEKSISVLLDKEESEIVFVDQPSSKILSDEYLSNYENPHGFCVVYSTTDRSSFRYAELFLQNLWKMDSIRSKAVILVGNKTDLVRSRVVTTEEGTNMATSYDSKFIETSVVINHNVDELLVGILSQIRLKQDNPPDPSIPRDQFYAKKRSRSPLANCAPRLYRGSKTSASLKVRKILSKVWSINSKSKSCENLHTL